MKAFVTGQDALREICPVWIQVSCDGVSVRACAKCTDMQLVQLGNVFQERLGVWSKLGVIPGMLRPQLEMIGILTEHTENAHTNS